MKILFPTLSAIGKSFFSRARSAHLRLGRRGENVAAKFLELKGYSVLSRNVRNHRGELDLIALDGATIVFVEVKTRRASSLRHPSTNLSPAQRKRNSAAARYLLKHYLHGASVSYRFDLIEIKLSRFRVTELYHWQNIPSPAWGKRY